MIKFPSIEQFRTVVRAVSDRAQYVSGGGDSEPVFDRTRPLPTIKYEGTVKLHGTNAGIVFRNGKDVEFQSRERILTETADNAGFYKWGQTVVDKFDVLVNTVVDRYHLMIDPGDPIDTVVIFGEWCGQGVQAGVAISQLPKMFVIFGIKVNDKWMNVRQFNGTFLPPNVFFITQFPTWYVEIPFGDPVALAETVNKLGELTQAVEDECPVGSAMGVKGIGEGIVWKPLEVFDEWNDSRFWFKVKGDKHSVSKVKKLASVDVEAVKAVSEFVDYAVTEARLEQGLNNLINEQLKPFEMKSLGDFIRWVVNDVKKEEGDVINENNLDEKKINPAISNVARQWYIKRFNSQ
jgi:hypothetical protein